MCSSPSTSLPLLMRWSVAASDLSSTAMLITLTLPSPRGRGFSYCFEIAAAALAAVLAQQQLRAEQRDQLAGVRVAERTGQARVILSRARHLGADHEIPRLPSLRSRTGSGSPRDDMVSRRRHHTPRRARA